VAVLGFLVAPPIVRHLAEKELTAFLKRPVSIGDVDINPFALSVTVDNLKIQEPAGEAEALGFDRLYVNLEAQSLVRGGVVLGAVRLDHPRFHLVRQQDGHYNWQDVIDYILAQPPSEKPTLFSVNNVEVSGGQAVFEDQSEGLTHKLEEVRLGLPFVSNLPSKVDIYVEPHLALKVNGTPLALAGKSKPFSTGRESELTLQLAGFDLAPLVAYLPFEPSFRLPSARLQTDLTLSFCQPEDGAPEVGVKGSLALVEVDLQEKDGRPVLKLPRLAVDIADFKLNDGGVHLARVGVEGPVLTVRRDAGGTINLLGLAPPASAPAAPAAAAKPFQYRVDQIELTHGSLAFADEAVKPAFAANLRDIHLEVRGLASQGDPAQVKLSLAGDGGETLEHAGTLSPAPPAAQGQIKLAGLNLPRLAAYYGAALPGGQVEGATLAASLDYELASGKDGPVVKLALPSALVTDLALRLNNDKAPLLRLPRLEVAEVKVDPAARQVAVGRLGLDKLQLSLLRSKDGRFNAEDLLGPAAPAKVAPKAGASGGKAEAPWTVTLGQFALEDASVRVDDRTMGEPIVLLAEQIGVEVKDFSTRPGARMAVQAAARINRKGSVAIKGTVAPQPLAADLILDLRGVDLVPLQPYAAERVNVLIARGKLTTKGRLSLATSKAGELGGRFSGDLAVTDFASIDQLNSADFMNWKVFSLEKVDLGLAPFALSIREVALTDFYTRLILDEKGGLNLREIAAQRAREEKRAEIAARANGQPVPPATPAVVRRGGQAETVVPAPASPPPPIRIDKVVLQGGRITYSDHFIKPNYDAHLTGMGGSLVGLSSDPATIATLDLQGKVDDAAPVIVVGSLNPFRQDRFLDIRAEVKDFELSAVSTYSGKYVGYGINKGKLSAQLGYKVEDRKLTATNHVFLDQLTFGDRVDSPDALKLPVLLAVSLLKNSRGEIDLDLPISGTLDDPEFSVGGLVVRAIMNLLVKAVTAPFALLGSIFGGGADLSYLQFDPGLALLGPAATEKLQAMAKALADRPALKVEVSGRADPAADHAGLKQAALHNAMAALKIKALIKKGESAPSLEEVVIPPAERPALLKQVYKDGDFKKPRNLVGLLKDIPDAEMETLILENTPVAEGDLRALAQQRAQVVRSWLVEQGKVAPERIFILAPRLGEDGKDSPAKTSRVDFSLK
jgi:uncharacterized protein involved in outer membrane biogenesis